jgi:hypothetical protein
MFLYQSPVGEFATLAASEELVARLGARFRDVLRITRRKAR